MERIALAWLLVIAYLYGCANPVPGANPEPEPLQIQDLSENGQTNADAKMADDDGGLEQNEEGISPIFTDMQGCEKKPVAFSHAPIELEAITAIEPQGELLPLSLKANYCH